MKITETRGVEIEVLSPVHIGTGVELEHDLDYVWHDGRIYVVNPDRYFSENLSSAEPKFQGFTKLLKPHEYARYERYSVVANERPIKLRPTVRSADGTVYIPGSTLKGAVRTAILGAMVKEQGGLDARDIGDRPASAAREIERRFFGRDPHHDLLRALRISDASLSAEGRVEAARVVMYTLQGKRLVPKGPNYEWVAEVILAGTRFQGTLTLDQHLLTGVGDMLPRYGPVSDLVRDFKGKREWVEGRLLDACNDNAHYLATREASFFQAYGPSELIDFYQVLLRQMEDARSNPSSTLLSVAWGTGWQAKTLSGVLEGDPDLLYKIRGEFRMGRQNLPFPKTRRLVFRKEKPTLLPLGWMKITMT